MFLQTCKLRTVEVLEAKIVLAVQCSCDFLTSVTLDIQKGKKEWKWKHLEDFCLLASCFASPPPWAKLTTGAEQAFEEIDDCEYVANIVRT